MMRLRVSYLNKNVKKSAAAESILPMRALFVYNIEYV